MASLKLTRGLPGSGKSTYATEWLAEAPEKRVRINRDEIRYELFKEWYPSDNIAEKEKQVTQVETQRIDKALREDKDVLVDNTNLNHKVFSRYGKIAARHNIPLTNIDFPIDIEESIRRNNNRDRVVPEKVIRDMASKYLSPKGEFHLWPGSHPIRPFNPPKKRQMAINFDMDGTLVNVFSIRHFVQSNTKHRDFDGFHRYSLWSPPNPEVVQLAKDAHEAGYAVLATTARGEEYREISQKWLEENDVPFDNIYMRPAKDNRPDYEIKKAMYDEIIEHYDVVLAVDDNPSAITAWVEKGIRVIEIPFGFPDESIEFKPVTVDNPFQTGKCVRCGRPLKNGGTIGPNCMKF